MFYIAILRYFFMSYEKIFGFFPAWVTEFDIEGKKYGGQRIALIDTRLEYFDSKFNIKGKRVLEFGPFEGGHSVMLHNLGAKEILAIEGRVENYVKCCVMKNIFNLTNSKFILADLENKDLEKYGKFDCCICLGVLYHLVNPYEFLKRVSKVTDAFFIWTHFSDNDYPKSNPYEISSNDEKNFVYRGKDQGEDIKDGQAGLQKKAFWFFKDDLLKALKDVGFKKCEVWGESYVQLDEKASCACFLAFK